MITFCGCGDDDGGVENGSDYAFGEGRGQGAGLPCRRLDSLGHFLPGPIIMLPIVQQ